MDMAVDLVSCMELVWINTVTSTKPIPNARDFIAVTAADLGISIAVAIVVSVAAVPPTI